MGVTVSAPRFDLDECRDELEREFIEALHSRAAAGGWYGLAWPRDDRIIVTVDLTDPEHNCALRMLRVDFDGAVMMAGPDETFQLATDLDPQRACVLSMQQQPPRVLANAAADWLEREMNRPIERHEWNRPTFRHRLWLHADTGEGLVESDSENKARADLGPPDRVVAVSTHRRRADVSAASIERIKRDFPPSDVEAAIATLARTEPGDDDLIHRILLRVSRGDLVALKRATWVAARDWRDVVFAARNLDLEDEEPESDGAEPPAPRSSPSPALARELVAAAESLRWAETLACSVEAGEVYVDHGDRAAELEVVGRYCDHAGVWIDAPAIFIIYRGVELPVPEEEYCVDVTSAVALATGWVRDGRHPDFDETDGLDQDEETP